MGTDGNYGGTLSLALERWRAGDPSGFDWIYRRYLGRLREIARLRHAGQLGVTEESLDVVQEVFVHLLRKPPSAGVRTEAELLRYLGACVENHVTDTFRHSRRRKRDVTRDTPARDGVDAMASIPTPDPTPSEVALGRETYQRYLQVVASLPEHEREAIVLGRHVGLSATEAATAMRLASPGAFRALLSRALAKVAMGLESDPGLQASP